MIDSYWVVRDSDQDIAHYGVKGMKWGVRRYQNEDGTLTSLGRRREDLKDAQQRHVKGRPEKIQKRVDVAYATREFNKEKTRQRINAKGYKKTKRQLANEKKYRDQGFTDDEAEIMAANRRRGVRIAMAAGGIAIAALGAYAAYRHYDRITDRLLSAGSELGRVGITDTEGLREGFYAFRKGVKRDATNYEGMYAKADTKYFENRSTQPATSRSLPIVGLKKSWPNFWKTTRMLVRKWLSESTRLRNDKRWRND